MTSKPNRKLVEKSKRILAKAHQKPMSEQFKAILDSGLINRKGQVQRNGTITPRKQRRPA
jgi:hypothetical protein